MSKPKEEHLLVIYAIRKIGERVGGCPVEFERAVRHVEKEEWAAARRNANELRGLWIAAREAILSACDDLEQSATSVEVIRAK